MGTRGEGGLGEWGEGVGRGGWVTRAGVGKKRKREGWETGVRRGGEGWVTRMGVGEKGRGGGGRAGRQE